MFPVGGETCKSWERLPPWGHTRHWFWHLLAIITIFYDCDFIKENALLHHPLLYLLGPLNRGFKVFASTEFRLSWMSFDCYSVNTLCSVTIRIQYVSWIQFECYIMYITYLSFQTMCSCSVLIWLASSLLYFFRVLNIIWLSQFRPQWISTTDIIWLLM